MSYDHLICKRLYCLIEICARYQAFRKHIAFKNQSNLHFLGKKFKLHTKSKSIYYEYENKRKKYKKLDVDILFRQKVIRVRNISAEGNS